MHWTQNPKWKKKLIEMGLKHRGKGPNRGSFKKGRKSPWKGKKISWVGHAIPHTEEAKQKMREHAHIMRGSDHPLWKGGKVGMVALHSWVKRNLGEPGKCDNCGWEAEPYPNFHWANKSGKYKRDLDDWMRLCVTCHRTYDWFKRQGVIKVA